MNAADDFHANVHDEPSLRDYLRRYNIGGTEAMFVVYQHTNGELETLVSVVPENPASAAAYLIRD